MKSKQIFMSVFEKEENGYHIWFPQFENLATCGDDFNDAVYMARDCLECHLMYEEIPSEFTGMDDILPSLEEGSMVVPIELNLYKLENYRDNRIVKKTLTLPSWVDEMAKENNLNFSRFLKEEIIKKYL